MSLFDVPGIRGGAVAAGIKPSGALDLAVLVAEQPLVAAGVFTRNQVAAAPVQVCRERLAASSTVRSVVINAGNANALTGRIGRRHAEAMVRATEQACGGPALVLSTGVIGVPLPMERVLSGIHRAAAAVDDGGTGVADAILTTDTTRKTAVVRCGPYTVGGLAKGSGMIHPNLATMLAVVATDAPIPAPRLRAILARAVDRSFHEITVDGDTSTNDAVLLLARPGDPLPDAVEAEVAAAITEVCRKLAVQIVEDGEGRARILTVEVRGAETDADAARVARSVATSSLVKTALAGGDPNWGRILAAAGNAGVALSEDALSLELGGVPVVVGGQVQDVDPELLTASFAAERVSAVLTLGRGRGRARMLTTDLTHRYVEINAEYTT